MADPRRHRTGHREQTSEVTNRGAREGERVLAIALSLALVIAAPAHAAATASPAARDPVIAAVGDLVCDPRPHVLGDIEDMLGGCDSDKTFALVQHRDLAGILILGDEQYEDGALDAFKSAYAKTWGKLNAISHPTPGNHEYHSSPTAAGYFTYFGKIAGDPNKGYYSFDIANWHMIALNGNCQFIGGCGSGSPQERWLRADLAQDREPCTLAYWHQPRFSSGFHGDDAQYAPFWNDLYAAHADIALAGHDHDYERFAPQDPDAKVDTAHGIREFVVGTGGRSHSFFLRVRKNSEVRASGTFGVLFVTLHAHGYDWAFTPVAGFHFSDRGSGTCHRPASLSTR
ncbi:MAG: metallophosphoesterase [Candidatus Eremiobacteraeota bacterium]|nr:metallophosphoesterase [Candidatus Eremiobacteraeota bacterium]